MTALSQGNDPNIGSARGTSTSSFVATLAVNSIVFVVLGTLFLVLRRPNRRIYAPLTCVANVVSWRKLKFRGETMHGMVDTVEGVGGFSKPLGWLASVWKLPDETVMRTNGMDGYLFLRYVRKAQFLCFVGVLMTFPLLLPLNATGGGRQAGLDILSFSNLASQDINRLYAHVTVSYLYFGFVLFVVYRELVYFVALRQAYMHSELYASKLSARTLLITHIPERYQDEDALRRVFGSGVEYVWINRANPMLESLVKRRDGIVMKLEEAEVDLIRCADEKRRKALRNGVFPPPASSGGGDAMGRWLEAKNRPTHRGKWWKKVDTIDWCREELNWLNPKVQERQALLKRGESGKELNSAFLSFSSQAAAQSALRAVIHDLTIQMAPRYIGVSPQEVIWTNLNVGFWERQIKVVAVTAAIAVMTLFWSVPNALVGTISQLDYLSQKVPFLKWINSLPKIIVGAIAGLLPPLMLSLLLDLVPKILTWLVTLSGEPSRPSVQLKVQTHYFIFLVIQVFLVTTITSAASAAATQIIKNPTSITDILAGNLPKASNFYISYMLLQGLSVSSSVILQFAHLILYKILAYFFDNTPRKSWKRWSELEDPGMGTLFPFYTNFCVIALTYSIIAPLVLLFATLGLGLVYFVYRYNLFFVYSVEVDTKGLLYPRAWFQTLTGVYLAEICLVGLFALKKAIGPVVLQLVLVAVTIGFQRSLTSNIQTLLEFLPDTTVPECEVESVTEEKKGYSAISVFATKTFNSFSTTSNLVPVRKGSVLERLVRPELYLDHRVLEKVIPRADYPPGDVGVDVEGYREAYYHPAATSTPPVVWVPRDMSGVAEREIRATSEVNPISDEGLVLDEKGHVHREELVVVPDWEEERLEFT